MKCLEMVANKYSWYRVTRDAINRLLILYIIHVILNNRSYPVRGVIGPANSRDAVMVAPLLSVAEIPLIGPYTSSDELSDKTR